MILHKTNTVSPDMQELVQKSQALVDDAKEKIKNGAYPLDMTSKMLVKDQCKDIEKYTNLILNGKAKEKDMKQLEVLMVRLQTSLDGIIEFYS